MVFDLIFILIFAWAAYKGYTKGFIIEAASLAALVLGIYGSIKLSAGLSAFLISEFNMNPNYIPIISLALIFIVIVLLVHLLAFLLSKLVDLVSLGFINRLFGSIFNIIKYSLIISVFLVILNNINRKALILPEKQMNSSIFYYPLSVLTPLLYPYLRYNFIPRQKITPEPGNEMSV